MGILTLFAATGGVNCGTGQVCDTGLPAVNLGSDQLHQVLSIVFGTLAALSVLMIVISGLRFVIAQGDSQEIAKARKTIIYSLAGLVVALIAEGIVAFVLGKL
jgi:hypothetical protein